ncbi:MAG: PLP-dependent aspartate aminotransferase family protein [Bacteriovoracaceae bacterium]|nr:PLP-dependent aspartate aminotransferase family protein [Bacteriovoracaceae bacterium]
MKKKTHSFETRAIHVGGDPDPVTGAIMPAIYQTSTYVQSSPGEHKGYEYSRTHNPTRDRLQECLASLEEADHCLVAASGLAASSLIMHALPHGSKVLCGDDVYGGTYRLFTKVFQDTHKFEFADTTNLKTLEAKVVKFKPALIWIETPTNPMLKISDIAGIVKIAKKVKAMVVVDNTFMSPYFQKPLTLGADIVMHSMTKYINGHSDVVAGALMLNKGPFYEKLKFLQNSVGPCLAPFDSWLVLRGIKTLAIRMEATAKNAIKVAEYLEKHAKVQSVVYPGLKSHPQHALAKKQTSGHGGMITFFIKGGIKESRKFLESVRLFALAESLGGVESLIEHPAIMTHASIPANIRKDLGIHDNLIRLSVGIEHIDDLLADLDQAFKKV